jgi:hypothetical protein
LSQGDITKRDSILWGYTFNECKPYIKYQWVFNGEAAHAFLFGQEDKTENEYCKVCRKLKDYKAEDCGGCSKKIEAV